MPVIYSVVENFGVQSLSIIHWHDVIIRFHENFNSVSNVSEEDR